MLGAVLNVARNKAVNYPALFGNGPCLPATVHLPAAEVSPCMRHLEVIRARSIARCSALVQGTRKSYSILANELLELGASAKHLEKGQHCLAPNVVSEIAVSLHDLE